MSQIYIEHDFVLRNDNGVLVATNGTVSAVTGTTLQYIDGTGAARVLNTSIVPELTNLYFTTARAQASISGSAPISVASGVVSITQANSTTNGYLSSTDWNTFNSKQQLLNGTGFVKIIGTTISYDNSTYYLASNPSNYISLISLSASAPLSYNNTTGVFSISQSSSSANGYLSSTDWNTFNSKQSALTFGNVTGSDFSITGGTGSVIGSGLALSLAIVNSNTYATNTFLKFSVNSKGLVTAASIVGGADIVSALGYTPEDVANKSTSTSLGTSNTLYPTQNAVKTYIDSAVAGVIILQGDWNASTNSPNISGTTTTGWAWRVSVDGATNLGGITDWKVGDLAVKSASGWLKIDNTDGVTSVFGRYGAIVATSGDYTTAQVTESGNLYYTDTRARASLSFVAGSGAYNSSTGIITIPTNTSQLTNGANFITLGSLSATPPISYNSGTGAISISQATTSTNGYLSSTDWNTFNNKLSTTTAASTYVPYTGATSDVDLGTHKLSLNSEQFASISAPSYSEGALWYDSTQKALAYYNDISGNVLHIGQEVQLKVHNNTGSTIAKGAPVYVTSTSSGGSSPNVALAKADTFTTSNVIGLANQAIPTGTDGYITLSGLLTGVSTGAFTVGDILYLSPYSAGQLMNTLPPTGYAIKVGVVSYSNSPNGTIYINQSNAYSTAGSIVGTIAISQGGTGATTAAGALSNLGGIGLTSLSASAPLSYNNTTGAFSISQATTSTNGYLSSTDWNTFNNKLSTSTAASTYVPYTGATTNVDLGTNYLSAYNININGNGSTQGASLVFKQFSGATYGSTGTTSIYAAGTNTLAFQFNQGGSSSYKGFQLLVDGITTGNTNTYYLPSSSGTLALTSQLSGVIYGSGVTYQVAWFNATNSIGGSSNLYFDPTNNRLGINQSSPLYSLDVTGASRITGQLILGSTITNGTYTYTLPSATGTLALTSQIPSLSGYVTGTAASGQVSYFNGTSSIAGSNNYYWDSTNNRLGIGLTNPQRSLTIYNATADNHLQIAGAAPSVSLTEAVTGAIYQAKFGLATASGQYVSGAVAGDFVIISQTGATIWANSGGERMRLNTNGTFSIGNTNSTYNLDVTGTGRFTGQLLASLASSGTPLRIDVANGVNVTSNTKFAIGTGGQYGTQTNKKYLDIDFNGYNNYTQARIRSWDENGSTGYGSLYFYTNGAGGTDATTLALQLNYNGAATFSSSVTAGGFLANDSTTIGIPFDTGGTKAYFNASSINGPALSLVSDSVGRTIRLAATAGSTYVGAIDMNTTGLQVGTNVAYPLIFATNATERMRITSGGNVGIGTSTPFVGGNPAKLQVRPATDINIGFQVGTADTTGIKLNAYNDAASVNIPMELNGSIMILKTAETERMRITSGGDVCVGTTSAIFSGKISIAAALYTTSVGLSIQNTQTTYGSATSFIAFVNSGGAAAGNIYQSAGTTVNYNTSSDARLKEDIGIATDTSVIDNTIIHDFTWKADSRVDRGVFAQEAYEVKPSAVGVGKDELTEGGELVQPWSVDYSKYVPDLIVHAQQLKKQVQEQQKQIEELKAKIK